MNTILCRSNILIPTIRNCLKISFLQTASAHKLAPFSNCSIIQKCVLANSENISYQQTRNAVSGFFNKHTAAAIWKGVSSVSTAGRRRGRGKIRGKKVIKDLNRGQIIGIGKENIRFPGLSSPLFRGRELMTQQKLPPDENYQANLNKLRQPIAKAKRRKVAPIDRGWSGGHAAGRKIGPPDAVGDATFEGFDTVILEQKPIFRMTRRQGRTRSVGAICGTGNGNGLFGYALATAVDARPAVNRAKKRAGQRLMYIPRHEDRTIIHNFSARFNNTRVFAWKQAPGFGLKCHRQIKSMCELIGIKDIYVKVEGGRSALAVMNAFLLGLLRQKSYDELAEETKLHVVEMNAQNDFFPKVLASPDMPIESSDETLDFELHCFQNNVYAWRKKLPPPFVTNIRYPIELRKREKRRSSDPTRMALLNEYGELRSFLTEEFPECRPHLPKWTRSIRWQKKAAEESENKADV